MDFTLDQLQVLDAIVGQGSFAGAGRALNRATSAVSYAVRCLEDALGIPLFDRSGHRARLTPAGELVLEAARGAVARARRVEQLAAQLREGFEPTMQVVLDGLLPLGPVVAALRRFTELRVPTRVRLRVEYLGGVAERFAADAADVMLTLDFRGQPGLTSHPLPPVALSLVAHRDHAIHQHPGPIDRAALGRYVEVVVEDSARAPAGPPTRLSLGSPHVFRLSDFHSKREALLGGVGVGWLPAHLAADALASGALAVVPFVEGAAYTFTPQLVHRGAEQLGLGARRFVAALLEEEAAATG